MWLLCIFNISFQAGPSGSQFGLLACLFVEVIQNWYILAHPWWALIKLSTVLVLLFILGLLPMIDNYAHLVGFIVGILLAFAMLPYVTFGKFDRVRKLVGIVICLLSAMGLFAGLIILFYVSPVSNCEYCRYFNCIPFTEKFCKSSEAKIVHEEFWYKFCISFIVIILFRIMYNVRLPKSQF